MSITVTEQIELVNIITLSENKLSRNFTILLNRLNAHDKMLESYAENYESLQIKINENLHLIRRQTEINNTQIIKGQNNFINQLKQIKRLQHQYEQVAVLNNKKIDQFDKELLNCKLSLQQNSNVQNRAKEQLQDKIQLIKKEINNLQNEIMKKQSRIEVEKIMKQVQNMKQKNILLDSNSKLTEHKIQRLEIYNQKNQRLQAKKDVQFTKQIDERVKKQIKATQKQISYQHRISNKDVHQGKENINLQQYSNNPLENCNQKKLPVICQEGLTVNQLIKISNENPIAKLNERIRNIQFQIANKMNENNNNLNKQKKQQKMIGRTQIAIKDKLNQLKPEMIKLWAKLDTLQDRIIFNERKIDEKNRLINELVLVQKQNNWTRMEEKVKMLQMEIYASLKEIKIKIDTKVNTSDYQNYLTLMEGKIKQINEMIALKSDKLEVKKALIFLQSKIKEIILVISQDEQNEKDALLTRKQLKCISCDKEVDKLSGVISGIKGNWDCMPIKDHAPEILGRFGMTSFGSLSKKLKKLENKDLPLLNKKNCNSNNNNNSNINNNNSNINNNSNNSP